MSAAFDRSRPTSRGPIQAEKSAKTRQALVDAAIRCIAKHGYQGATLGMISKEAGLSQGPRQYHFPNKIDLMVAVWEQIIANATISIQRVTKKSSDIQTILNDMISSELKRCKTDEYLADLELKGAIRADDKLRAVLLPRIDAFQDEVDDWWLDLLSTSGLSSEELISARYVLVWMLRGFAIEQMSLLDDAATRRFEGHLRQFFFNMIFPKDNALAVLPKTAALRDKDEETL